MKHLVAPAIILGFCLVLVSGLFVSAGSFEVNPKVLGQLGYSISDRPADRRYLGVSGSDFIRLPQIRAELIIIEVFNMYCHYCQAEAPNVNKLYEMIEGNPALKGRVKIIGIGLRNTPYEVNLFRKKFSVPFPLFSDPEAEIQKVSDSKVRTPTFIIVKKEHGSSLKIVHTHAGRIGNLNRFLEEVQPR